MITQEPDISIEDTLSAPKIKAVGYCRFSSDMQREESIDAQKRFISVFASQNNYEIINFYCDRAKSGKNTNRPAFQQMLEDSKKGNFTSIVVHKLDRFSRNTADTLDLIDTLRSRDVEVVSAYERFENNPMGQFMLKILSGMSEYYISNLANEVLKGQKENAYKALSNGGIGCLGYDIVDKKYVINETEREAVKLIFEMYSSGYGYNSIIDKLNSLGYKTKAGRDFGKNSLYAILSNEKYIGNFTFNKIARGTSRGKRNSHKMKPESEIIRLENGIPAIISKELWNMVQSIRKVNPKGRSHNKYFYLLSGLIYCGECGYKMHGNPRNTGNGGPTYVTYRCNHNDNNRSCDCKEVRREYVEAFVIEELFNHFFNNDAVPKITQQLNEKLLKSKNDHNEEYLKYKATLQLLEKARSNLLVGLKETGYNKSIGDELKDVESQMERCLTFIKECDAKSNDIPTFTEEQVIQNLAKLKEFAKHSEREEVRSMIQNYVERVTVFNDKVEVVFKAAFSFYLNQSITYTCNSYISRKRLERFGRRRLFSEVSQNMIENLHSA